jgi:hypothetical protein
MQKRKTRKKEDGIQNGNQELKRKKQGEIGAYEL